MTIIILTWNKLEFTKKCLEHLNKNTSYENWDVIIVDNGSKDGTVSYLDLKKEKFPKIVTIVKNKTNLGFAKGCNQGAKLVKGEYILFLNNDVFVYPKWLQNMVKCLEKDDTRAIVGAKLLYPQTKKIQHAGVIILPHGYPTHQCRNFPHDHPKVNVERLFPAVTAACLLIKTEIFWGVGGFDERFGIGSYEDVDLCLKVQKKGYKIVYCPTSVGIHYERTSCNQIPDFDRKISAINEQKFLDKWFPHLKVGSRLNLFYFFVLKFFRVFLDRLTYPRGVLALYQKAKWRFGLLEVYEDKYLFTKTSTHK